MRMTRIASVVAVLGLVAASAPGQQLQQAPPAAAPRVPAQGMPAMAAPTIPPVNLVPAFLEKGKVYTFTIVRKQLKGEVMEVDRAGWVRVNFREDDEDFDGIPWLNLNHVTLIVPEKPDVKPATK